MQIRSVERRLHNMLCFETSKQAMSNEKDKYIAKSISKYLSMLTQTHPYSYQTSSSIPELLLNESKRGYRIGFVSVF